MTKTKSFLRVFTESGPLVALAVAIALVVGIAGPASAQFFNFGNFGGPQRPQPRSGGGWFGGDFFAPFQQQQAPKRVIENYSKAPPPEKRETVPERNVLVLGDAMADWLAYGLEDAYSEQPDMGVIRKHKTVSGLIKYQPKGDPADWPAAARGILATEKADAIVVMLGLNDRVPIHEPVVDKSDSKSSDKKSDKKDAKAKPDAKPGDAKPGAKPDGATDNAAKPEDKAVDTELSPDDAADNGDAPPAITPEKSARSPNGVYEFREERWVELYTRKIDEMIAVMKSKGVPVLWVGLPAVRGARATSDMLFLDSLYRDAAGKAGITYVDVWDGFVDEAGRFLQQGPDFEGQIRRLRQRPTPMRCRVSRHRVRWRDRSCRWWHLRSVPINCSAAPARARPRSMRSPRARWSRESRWRRQPAARMILSGRAVKSDANRRRAKLRRHPLRRMERQRRPPRRRSRKSSVRFNPARLRFSDLATRPGSSLRHRVRPPYRARRAMSDARRRSRASSIAEVLMTSFRGA